MRGSAHPVSQNPGLWLSPSSLSLLCSGRWGCHTPPPRKFLHGQDFDSRQGLSQTAPPRGRSSHLSPSPPPVAAVSLAPAGRLLLYPASCCRSAVVCQAAPSPFFNLTTRDSKMRTLGQLRKTFCGGGGVEERTARGTRNLTPVGINLAPAGSLAPDKGTGSKSDEFRHLQEAT